MAAADEISLGMRVRYPRTGTTGSVVRIEQVSGNRFAELDSTHLLYRVDLLIPTEEIRRVGPVVREEAKDIIRREREYAAGQEFQESLKNIDQSCEGGG